MQLMLPVGMFSLLIRKSTFELHNDEVNGTMEWAQGKQYRPDQQRDLLSSVTFRI